MDGVPLWVINREEMNEQKEILAAKFEELYKQKVVHMAKKPLQAWVTDLAQHPVGMVDLNPEIWDQEIRKDIVHRVVRWQRNSWRQGTHKTKTRSEVSGGGAKPRPQKGSGRSRQGSIRSPLWVGGGRAFPQIPRDHSHKLQLKVIKKGMMIALTAKYQENNLFVIDGCELDSHRTQTLAQLLKNWDIGEVAFIHGINELENNFALAVRNIPNVQTYNSRSLGVFQLLKHHQMFITKQGLQELEASLLNVLGVNSPADDAHPRRRIATEQPEGFEAPKLAQIVLQQSS